MDIKERIIYKSFCTNIEEILSTIDVFVLASEREGFSRSMLEAMSCSLPIIATKISEIEEAIIDNQNGLLVEFKNHKKMASAILTFYKNENLRKEIGARNRLAVDRKYNIISHAKEFGSLYSSFI